MMMKHLKTTFFFSFLFTACSDGNHTRQPASLTVLENLQKAREFTPEELNVAMTICYAMKSKRLQFRSKMLGSSFNFELSDSKCGGEINGLFQVETTLRTKSDLSIGELFFQQDKYSRKNRDLASESSFLGLVQTDIHGHLGQVCPEVLKNNNLSNTFSISETQKRQIVFDLDNKDGFSVFYAKEDDQKKFKIYRVDKFKVLSNFSSSGSYFGQVKESVRTIRCSDGSAGSQVITQKILRKPSGT